MVCNVLRKFLITDCLIIPKREGQAFEDFDAETSLLVDPGLERWGDLRAELRVAVVDLETMTSDAIEELLTQSCIEIDGSCSVLQELCAYPCMRSQFIDGASIRALLSGIGEHISEVCC